MPVFEINAVYESHHTHLVRAKSATEAKKIIENLSDSRIFETSCDYFGALLGVEYIKEKEVPA